MNHSVKVLKSTVPIVVPTPELLAEILKDVVSLINKQDGLCLDNKKDKETLIHEITTKLLEKYASYAQTREIGIYLKENLNCLSKLDDCKSIKTILTIMGFNLNES